MKRKLKGKVVSDKMEKTLVVAVERIVAHPVYKKQVKITKHFKAHDESGAKVGNEVVIEETRPISRGKRWKVVEVGGKKVTEETKATKEIEVRKKKPETARTRRGKKESRPLSQKGAGHTNVSE